MILEFPDSYSKYKYRDIHLSYFIHTATLAGIDVRIVPPSDTVWMGMVDIKMQYPDVSMVLDGQQVIVNFLDRSGCDLSHVRPMVPYFKTQYDSTINTNPNIFPIGTIYGLSAKNIGLGVLEEYHTIRSVGQYLCRSDVVSNVQRIFGAAVERRTLVRNKLVNAFDAEQLLLAGQAQKAGSYWKSMLNCLVVVSVPGASMRTLDRNQVEAFGLGVCTISPKIHTVLANNVVPVADEHYLECRDDFSDVVDIINWCKNNRDDCRRIGTNAKQLFDENCTPVKLWEWMHQQSKIPLT